MGKIEIFSIVRALLLGLSGLLDERWMQSTKYFRRVSMSNESELRTWKIQFSLHFCVLQALEDGRLKLTAAFFVVQEKESPWPQTVSSDDSTGHRQDFRHAD